ncbi:MAG: hypothetical protein R3F10_10840 [Lysobacteraceae bacterium]
MKSAASATAEHPALNAAGQLASAYNTLNRPAEAEPLLRYALDMRSKRGEGELRETQVNRVMLATTLSILSGRNDEAMVLVDEIVHWSMANRIVKRFTARNIRAALLLHKMGHLDEARAAFAEITGDDAHRTWHGIPELAVIPCQCRQCRSGRR